VARPIRYTFILVLVALGTALAAVAGWRYARASAPVPGPIILITIDTLRADHLPAYGYRHVATPAIDTLARDGVVFERAYAHAVQTLPAHMAILTGRLPFDTGVRDDVAGALKAGERLLPQMLHDRGYATGGIVSSGLLRRDTGIAQGFDFFDDEMSQAPAADAELTATELRRDGAESEAVAERWLTAVGSTRIFVFLHLHEPHAPYPPPARYGTSGALAPYDGAIAYADEIVGRFIRFLKTHQLYDQSTIVLVSDHGEGLGDHGEQEHGLFVYDEAIHVPLIIKQAGGVDAGRRVAELVQQADIVPTVLDLAKAPVPGNLRGRSLKALADGAAGDELPDRFVYAEALYGQKRFGWSALETLTDGRFQYIRAPREELYDLERDPRQHEDVSSEIDTPQYGRAPRRTTLDRLLGESGESHEPADPGADPKDKREIAAQYRAALALTAQRKWPQAIDLLQKVVRDDPDAAGLWNQLGHVATLAERYGVALDAYQHVALLRPLDAEGFLGAAEAALKGRRFDEAQEHAERATEAGSRNPRRLAEAHTVLANIALARHDTDAARREALLVRQADPATVLPLYVDARLLYDEGNYADALPLFERANAHLRKTSGIEIPDLHYLTGDTLLQTDQYPEAEAQLREELRYFPHNVRASAAMATLYQSTERPDAAARVTSDLVRITPTPESYALAARLWTSLGDLKQAAAVRAEGRRTFSSQRSAH
jgi:choline-sulfatase